MPKLCREHGLSVIEHPHKAPSRPVWLAEKRGEDTLSPVLREDIRKMDEIGDQVRYMGRNNINTMEDLQADRENLSAEIKELTAERRKIYNKLRRAKPEDVPALRAKRDDVSKKIEALRKDLKCNHKIEERSAVIKDKLLLDVKYKSAII